MANFEITDEAVERAAMAVCYAVQMASDLPPDALPESAEVAWGYLDEDEKDEERKLARVALEAALTP
jgi:hypothetical protein